MLTPAVPWCKRDTKVFYNLSALALADACPAAVTMLWRGAVLYLQLPFLAPCCSSSFHRLFLGGIQPVIKFKRLVTAHGSSWVNSSQGLSNKRNIFLLLQSFSHQLLQGLLQQLSQHSCDVVPVLEDPWQRESRMKDRFMMKDA